MLENGVCWCTIFAAEWLDYNTWIITHNVKWNFKYYKGKHWKSVETNTLTLLGWILIEDAWQALRYGGAFQGG